MKKSIIGSMLLTVFMFADLPISTEFTDWDKNQCNDMRSTIYKGFNQQKESDFKDVIKRWNNLCTLKTGYIIFTSRECKVLKKRLYKSKMTKQKVSKWNKNCSELLGVKIIVE